MTKEREAVVIGADRQLFVDSFLVDAMRGARLVLHRPVRRNVAIGIDHPWEAGGVSYMVAFRDGDRFRAWYRCDGHSLKTKETARLLGTGYAESTDGVHWTKPTLGVCEFDGSTDNNLVDIPPSCVNVAPFKDLNPDCPEDERYKAVARDRRDGLRTLVSPDGVRWRQLADEIVLTDGPYDSHNIAFHDPWTGRYVAYTRGVRRDGTPGHAVTPGFGGAGVRWVRRSVSDDFRTWSPRELITTGDAPIEELYTNACVPYERARGLYLMFPSRFVASRKPDPDWSYEGVNDGVFLSSRDGLHFDRTFMEAFLRPGPVPENWHDRSVYIERGILETGPAEMSMFAMEHWRLPTNAIRRLSLRTDGFVSVQAPYAGGELVTRPVVFEGSELRLNVSTSAAGSARVEVQDAEGRPLPGLALDDCDEIFGDEIDRPVTWKSPDALAAQAGKPVRLRFVLQDADLYSFRFC